MPDKRQLALSRRQLLGGLGAVGAASAGAGLGTTALFSDEESFNNNSITAGQLDLVVDYETSYDFGSEGDDSGEINGNPGDYSYVLSDVKPGDSGSLFFCPKVVDNPGWVYVGSDGIVEYENSRTEPEADVDASDGDPGQGAGELATSIQVTVSYCDETGSEIRELNNPADYTLADLSKDLETGFLLDGDTTTSGRQAYPDSSGPDDQQGPCLCINWNVPASVGNEIQSDSVELDFMFAATQERNNPDPANPFVDHTVGSASGFDHDTLQAAVNAASPGDVISVASESFNETVTVDKAVTIIGAGEGQTVIDATGFERGFAIENDGVTVCGLTIANPGVNVSTGEVEGIFIGDASGFTDTSGFIRIQDVTITGVSGGDKTAEGIHAKKYNSGDPIDGLLIDDVTIDGVNFAGAGADGIKLQADVRNVLVKNSVIKNIAGKWSYGIVLTPSSGESGTPSDVSVGDTTIDTITANTYSGVGLGIDSASGGSEPDSGDNVADPRELSAVGNTVANLDIGVLDKNTTYSPVNVYGNIFQNVSQQIVDN